MAERRRTHFDVHGLRIDEFPWRIHVNEFGDGSGPATAILAGIIGDKPLGVLALHELAARLEKMPVRGRVLIIPAANPFGLEGGTRHNPDFVEFNRRFPGSTSGMITDQLANALLKYLLERVDCVVDVHSGTPMRKTHFAYDYGDLELTASFAHVPIMVGRNTAGQLCTAVRDAGGKASLIEFGGAGSNDTSIAVEGCLNMLRYRGHIDGDYTGPDKVDILDQVKLFFASRDGALDGPFDYRHVGKPVDGKVLGWVTNVVTGERLEEFTIEQVGETAGTGAGFDRWGPSVMKPFKVERPPILMVSQTLPAMVRPGLLAFMVGWVGREVPASRR